MEKADTLADRPGSLEADERAVLS